MILFWTLAALMVAIALGMLLPPLLGTRGRSGPQRDDLNVALYEEHLVELNQDLEEGDISQEKFEQAKIELERGLLQDVSGASPADRMPASPGRWMGVVVGVVVPLLALGIYSQLGAPGLIPAFGQTPAQQAAGQPGSSVPSVEEMVNTLATRLQSQPDDAEGWVMLGRSYVVLRRYAEATKAYAKAHDLLGDQPGLLADYAEAWALANDNRLAGHATALLKRALVAEPENTKALWLMGMAHYQAGEFASALENWRKLLAQPQLAQEDRTAVQDLIARAEVQLNGAPMPAVSSAPSAAPAATQASAAPAEAPGASLKVHVSLDPALASTVSPDTTVFVFAKAESGPPMPLAVARRMVKDLPVSVELTDGMAMMPAMKLSNFPKVVVGARISRSGSPVPSSGDLQGLSAPIVVASAAQPVEISINQRVP